ncbi:hypothetical protein GCM10009639_51260 [Kitasatospora putterlickiae]|uniref:Lipoprotein n=1 Tax=Kitasatospora putterlickiae TaxID=221725 RepID=A0ABN1YD03_9ACTN
MAKHLTNRAAGVALLVAGALAVAACDSSPDGGSAETPPPLGPVTTITDPGQITMPTDAYIPTVAQVRQVQRAQDAVTADCMREFGFTARPTEILGLDDAPRQRLTHSAVYGYFDADGMQSNGYNNGRAGTPPPAATGAAPPPSADEQTALTGDDPRTRQKVDQLNGKPVPPGGCAQKGRDTVGPLPMFSDAALPEGGPKIPANDPRVAEAYGKWSACMKEKGFDYKDPVAANIDAKWREPSERPPSANQIATATADVACKIANNTVGVIVAVQQTYANRYIEANAAKLAEYRQKTDDQLKKAAQLVASSGQAG